MSNLVQRLPYRGRFAPSPSGPLHFGSLVAALASYLQARSQQGQWLVRIEDIDPPREQAGAAAAILRTLEAFGLHWDEPVIYQSQRYPAYQAALQQLQAQGHLYRCSCNRLRLQTLAGVYDGHCRRQPPPIHQDCAWRVHHQQPLSHYQDQLLGRIDLPRQEQDDFIVQRKDGLFAYQLAVVVDDADSKISEVVRGSDLLMATGRQLYLYHLLQRSTPAFLHLPVANHQGLKLSKQNQAPALRQQQAPELLQQALAFLGQTPVELDRPECMLNQAIQQWQPNTIPQCWSQEITAGSLAAQLIPKLTI